jgi:hypothetical protein
VGLPLILDGYGPLNGTKLFGARRSLGCPACDRVEGGFCAQKGGDARGGMEPCAQGGMEPCVRGGGGICVRGETGVCSVGCLSGQWTGVVGFSFFSPGGEVERLKLRLQKLLNGREGDGILY